MAYKFFKGDKDYFKAVENSPVGDVSMDIFKDSGVLSIALAQDFIYDLKDKEMVRELIQILAELANDLQVDTGESTVISLMI